MNWPKTTGLDKRDSHGGERAAIESRSSIAGRANQKERWHEGYGRRDHERRLKNEEGAF